MIWILLLSMYFIEALAIYCWYRFIISVKCDSNVPLRRLIYYVVWETMIRYTRLIFYGISAEQHNEELENQEQVGLILDCFVIACFFVIFIPIICILFMNNKMGFIVMPLIFFSGVALIVERLIKNTEEIVLILSYLNKRVSKFGRIRYSKKDLWLKKISGKRMFQLFVMLCGLVLFYTNLFKFMSQGVEKWLFSKWNLILASLAGTYLLLDKVKFHKNNRPQLDRESEVICSDSFLYRWNSELISMCNKIGINDVIINSVDSCDIVAYASMEKKKCPEVMISRCFVEGLEHELDAQDCYNIVKFILGHELIHIFYKDDRAAIRYHVLAYFGTLAVFVGTIWTITHIQQSWIGTVGNMIILLDMVFLMICQDRFWVQFCEIRADVLGIQFSRTAISDFIKLNEFYEDLVNSEKKDTNVIYKIYTAHISEKDHPSMNRRIKMLEIGSWSYKHFLFLMYEIIRGIVKGEGWYGA